MLFCQGQRLPGHPLALPPDHVRYIEEWTQRMLQANLISTAQRTSFVSHPFFVAKADGGPRARRLLTSAQQVPPTQYVPTFAGRPPSSRLPPYASPFRGAPRPPGRVLRGTAHYLLLNDNMATIPSISNLRANSLSTLL